MGQSVLDGLTSLVNKNVLRADRDSATEMRFALLETIREFAMEQLQASGEADSVGARHAAHYLAVAEQDELAYMQGSPAHVQWLERMKHEQDNFRAALRWAAAQGASDVELRLAAALSSFWTMAGYAREGLLLLSEGLARSSSATSRARAKGSCPPRLWLSCRVIVTQGSGWWRKRNHWYLNPPNGICADSCSTLVPFWRATRAT
jgi:predicted ATPase